jgi:hypothetical protein
MRQPKNHRLFDKNSDDFRALGELVSVLDIPTGRLTLHEPRRRRRPAAYLWRPYRPLENPLPFGNAIGPLDTLSTAPAEADALGAVETPAGRVYIGAGCSGTRLGVPRLPVAPSTLRQGIGNVQPSSLKAAADSRDRWEGRWKAVDDRWARRCPSATRRRLRELPETIEQLSQRLSHLTADMDTATA